MRALAPLYSWAIGIIITLLVIPAGIMAQPAGDAVQNYKFSKEELTQMLAPIALYPDALTAQVLMASTYPLEVVEADRWRSQTLQLQGKDLDAALQDKEWDPSIKSLCHFPDILKSMSDKLDQTRKLGDAFLGQQEEVMATLQELRSKARAQGHLNTTSEQKVHDEAGNIRIEPANPETIYVPVYDPFYVYGPWWYPDYPPYYWYYPTWFYGGVSIAFGPGIFFGFDAFSWAWFDWPYHRIHIDRDRIRRFDRHFDKRDDDGDFWKHDPRHRQGVAYRDQGTSEHFGARAPLISPPPSPERRGYPGEGIEQSEVRQSPSQRGERPVAPPASGISGEDTAPPRVQSVPAIPQREERSVAPQSPRQIRQAPATKPPASAIRRESNVTPWSPSVPAIPQRPVVRETPFRGIDQGNFERRAAERGSQSNRNVMREPSGGQLQQRQGEGGSRGSEQGGGSRRER